MPEVTRAPREESLCCLVLLRKIATKSVPFHLVLPVNSEVACGTVEGKNLAKKLCRILYRKIDCIQLMLSLKITPLLYCAKNVTIFIQYYHDYHLFGFRSKTSTFWMNIWLFDWQKNLWVTLKIIWMTFFNVHTFDFLPVLTRNVR